jgi:hypothetical protein
MRLSSALNLVLFSNRDESIKDLNLSLLQILLLIYWKLVILQIHQTYSWKYEQPSVILTHQGLEKALLLTASLIEFQDVNSLFLFNLCEQLMKTNRD